MLYDISQHNVFVEHDSGIFHVEFCFFPPSKVYIILLLRLVERSTLIIFTNHHQHQDITAMIQNGSLTLKVKPPLVSLHLQ